MLRYRSSRGLSCLIVQRAVIFWETLPGLVSHPHGSSTSPQSPEPLCRLQWNEGRISIRNGSLSKATRRAHNCRISMTAVGKHWTYLMTGALKDLSVKMLQLQAMEPICPPALGGIESNSLFRPA